MKHIINNKDYSNEVGSLSSFAQKRLGFSKMPKILFDDDVPNSQKTLGKTGYYDPSNSEIHIYASGRHIKDILRSVAHELVHHMQNEKGDLTHDGYMGQGYAQKNPKMREMERQAYEQGNLCFRDWEDSLKEKHPTIYNERRNRKMSLKDWKNKELNENLNKRWGFSMNLNNLNEARDSSSDAAAAFDRKAEKELAGKIAKAGLKTAKEVNDKFGDWIKDNIQPPTDGSVTKALKMAKEKMDEGFGAGPMDPMGGESSMDSAPPMSNDEMNVIQMCVDQKVAQGVPLEVAGPECEKEIAEFTQQQGRAPEKYYVGSTPGENPEFSNLLESEGDISKPDEEGGEEKSEEEEKGSESKPGGEVREEKDDNSGLSAAQQNLPDALKKSIKKKKSMKESIKRTIRVKLK